MTNRLIHEQSPYLLQHAHNPVDWYPWGDEAFERAAREHKPVIVSIGYSACHWCHVMERESFENEAVAAYMNAHFINIKVDREEHPGVDHLYMDAVQAISGSGGWPLNVFVTPGRAPFYGGTYYPPAPAYSRPSWMQLLQRMNEIWTTQQEELGQQAEQMLQYLRQTAQAGSGEQATPWDIDTCREIAWALLKQGDRQYGGFGRAPKFPGTMAISFLLEHYHFTKDKEALGHALLSLDGMINGGIYDQLGGGFARYSTDEKWLAPHFEKMLYDNALLLLSLCDAYQVNRDRRYRQVIEETVAFAERELCDETGIYYCALDADSEGVEGKFYTWTWEEWREIIDDELVTAYFGVVEHGNWEHTNILHLAKVPGEFAREHGVSEEELKMRVEKAKALLLAVRAKRVRPATDDKSLLSWNALMSLALTRAATVLQHEDIISRADDHMDRLLENFDTAGGLKHVWKKGTAKIDANLDDYAYLIQALLQLASAGSGKDRIQKASELCEIVCRDFSHEDGNFFYYSSSGQTDIPVRKTDLYDGATPSANAVMANNLLLLGMCMERYEWTARATNMLQYMAGTVQRYPYSFGYWAIMLQRYASGLKTIVNTGRNALVIKKELDTFFLPGCYLLTSQKEISEVPILKDKSFPGESLIFVCTQQACLAPVQSVAETLQLISAIE